MSYSLVIPERAQEEIDEAYEYYSEISHGVMKSFDHQLEQVYQSLETNPFFQFRYKNLRALPFKSFPYLIFFSVDEQEKIVYIYSIFNTNQDPHKYPNLKKNKKPTEIGFVFYFGLKSQTLQLVNYYLRIKRKEQRTKKKRVKIKG